MTEAKRRKLPSLQRQIEAYSIKAWYTVPAARAYHGIDPNSPREPEFFGSQVRLAARVVDELVGGHSANLGKCDCRECSCEWEPGKYAPCWHDLTCPHIGPEEAATLTPRQFQLIGRQAGLRQAFAKGEDAVYELARLTLAESEVASYQHRGISRSSIARMTNRADGTVNALLRRVHRKLRALAIELEELAA